MEIQSVIGTGTILHVRVSLQEERLGKTSHDVSEEEVGLTSTGVYSVTRIRPRLMAVVAASVRSFARSFSRQLTT